MPPNNHPTQYLNRPQKIWTIDISDKTPRCVVLSPSPHNIHCWGNGTGHRHGELISWTIADRKPRWFIHRFVHHPDRHWELFDAKMPSSNLLNCSNELVFDFALDVVKEELPLFIELPTRIAAKAGSSILSSTLGLLLRHTHSQFALDNDGGYIYIHP